MSGEAFPSDGIEVAPGVVAPEGALRFAFVRCGGPGGQNVNKLSTKAQLHVRVDALRGLSPAALDRLRDFAGHRLTAADEILLVSESERGQEANKSAVLERLREMIVRAKTEPKVRKRSKPSRSQKARRLEGKKRRSDIKKLRRPSFDS
jgi:ribosome-associated protein